MQAVIEILVVGPLLDREFEGRKYQVQEAECVLRNDDGSPACVGVLRLWEALRGANAPKPGLYTGTFSLKPNSKRIIEAVLVSLTAMPVRKVV